MVHFQATGGHGHGLHRCPARVFDPVDGIVPCPAGLVSAVAVVQAPVAAVLYGAPLGAPGVVAQHSVQAVAVGAGEQLVVGQAVADAMAQLVVGQAAAVGPVAQQVVRVEAEQPVNVPALWVPTLTVLSCDPGQPAADARGPPCCAARSDNTGYAIVAAVLSADNVHLYTDADT